MTLRTLQFLGYCVGFNGEAYGGTASNITKVLNNKEKAKPSLKRPWRPIEL
jgi:hypothetical protein